MKKFFSILCASLLITSAALSLFGCDKKSDIPVIGISQFAEHGSLDNCRTGFLEGLKEAGLVEGKDFTVDYQNAGADTNIASQIGQNFASRDVALMCAIATPSATACFAAAEDKDIPVVFTAITDPVLAKLTEGNVTGTSDKLPVTAQLELIRAMQPDAKTIGIIYNTSEPNSVSAIKEYEDNAGTYGFTIDAVGITAQAEVTQAADTLISRKVDCFSNLTDNMVVDVLPSVLEKTNEAGIPVYGSEVEQVKLGCVASAGIDYIALGKKTGAMAAKILRGEAKASDLPYETISEFGYYVNTPAAEKLSVTIPAAIAEKAIESSK